MLKTKLTYMALGALIASIGYFIGSIDYDVKAQEQPKRIVCDELIVKNFIAVGDDNDKGFIFIKAENGQQSIRIGGDKTGHILLHVKDKLQVISIQERIDHENRSFRESITLSNRNGENNITVGSIKKGMVAIDANDEIQSISIYNNTDAKNPDSKVFIYSSNDKTGMSVGISEKGRVGIISEKDKNSIIVGNPAEGVVGITSENGITTMLLDDANGSRLINTTEQ